MALQISPILSTPHFILLHAGLLYCSATAVAEGDRKSCVPSFPENYQTDSGAAYEEKACSHSRTELASLAMRRVVVYSGNGAEIEAYFDVFCHDQLRGLMVIGRLCGPLVMWARLLVCVCRACWRVRL